MTIIHILSLLLLTLLNIYISLAIYIYMCVYIYIYIYIHIPAGRPFYEGAHVLRRGSCEETRIIHNTINDHNSNKHDSSHSNTNNSNPIILPILYCEEACLTRGIY